MALETGDVVYLKSGSVPMTVRYIGKDSGKAYVEWMMGGELYESSFHPEQLLSQSTEHRMFTKPVPYIDMDEGD